MRQRSGFTLVEIAIVLVIVGLLIGGILAAQSMISAAKIQSTVRMLGQFDASVANFQSKYSQLPGDTNLMGIIPGNNDGMLTSFGGLGCDISSGLRGEIGKFWSDLSFSGLKTTGANISYTDASGGASGPSLVPAGQLIDTYIPKLPLGSVAGVAVCGTAPGQNYYVLSNFYLEASASNFTAVPQLALKGQEALAIDTKIDDGLPASGEVKGSDISYSYYGLVQSLADTTCKAVSGIYNISSEGFCSLYVRIGTTSGNLQ